MCKTTNPIPSAAVLMDIYKAQEENAIFAFDQADAQRSLARLRRAYAEKLEAYDKLEYVFEMGRPQITLRVGTCEVSYPLPMQTDLYDCLRQQASEELRKLEQSIVLAHVTMQQEAEESVAQKDGPRAYVQQIVALCQSAFTFPTT